MFTKQDFSFKCGLFKVFIAYFTYWFLPKAKAISDKVARDVSKQSEKCYLIVRENRNVSKYRDGKRYMDSPDNGQDERKLAREISIDMLCLTLFHQK